MLSSTMTIIRLTVQLKPKYIPIVGVGKRGAYQLVHGDLPRHHLEVYWPCAGGLSAVNTIGTRLRDPINSGHPVVYGGLNE